MEKGIKIIRVNMTDQTIVIEDVPQDYMIFGGRVLQADDELQDGKSVSSFQAVYGG
jgi:hypothetical protein